MPPTSTMHFLTLSALVAVTVAFHVPSWLPFAHSLDPQVVLNLPAPDAANRIAIVGAGAAGSSAAFWIAKAKERYGLDVEVDLFEKSGLFGGSECSVFTRRSCHNFIFVTLILTLYE